MANNTCSICGKAIHLNPSAEERARKYGNTPQFYRNLFTTHSECQVKAWYSNSKR